jgi:acetyl esterase/lipase
MTAALTLMAKQRGGPSISAQLLYYPVTDANFDTDSYSSSPATTGCAAKLCSGSGTSTRPTRLSAPRSPHPHCGPRSTT